MPPRLNHWLAVAVVATVAADWLSKFWIANQIALGETWALVDGWLYLAHRRNPGVAFSMFADLPDRWRTPLLALLALLGVGALLRLAWSVADRWIRAGSALAIAGAIGNLGDRVVNGGVTDFILFLPFPFVFNVADAAITVGAVLVAASTVLGAQRSEPPPIIEA